MNSKTLTQLLQAVADGRLDIHQAQEKLTHLAIEDIDYAHIDHHRSLRKGFPEVIFGQGKSAEQIIGIMSHMAMQEQIVLVTRLDSAKAELAMKAFPQAIYDKQAHLLVLQKKPLPNEAVLFIAIQSYYSIRSLETLLPTLTK